MRKWLKNIRLDRGVTQEAVAKASGISRCYYTQLETNQRKGLHPSTAIKIARYLTFDWTRFYQEELRRAKEMDDMCAGILESNKQQ